jgi:hypothetical protein
MMHPAFRYLAVLLMLGCSAATAGEGGAATAALDLYRAKTRVTGQTVEGRGPAVARCFTDVLVKVSGDARLLSDPGVAEAGKQAGALVKDYRYRDLMAGLPTNDEQGTRDRPYDLTVSFHPERIDAALRSLGREPWSAPRPRLVVFLGVRLGATSYLLASDGERGRDQSLAAAAARFGMPMTMPDRAALAKADLSYRDLAAAGLQSLDARARTMGGDLALAGSLLWSEEALGWVADWRLDARGASYHWQIRGVGFDDAFRNAMAGAAQILSGHGQPG